MFSTLVRWNELIASRKMVILLLSFIDSSAAIVKYNCPKTDSRLWNKVNPCDCPYNLPTFACGSGKYRNKFHRTHGNLFRN